MPLSHIAELAVRRTRPQHVSVRYAGAAVVVALTFVFRQLLAEIWPFGQPFLTYSFAVLVSATMFGQGPAFATMASCAALASWFYLPPIHSLYVESSQNVAALVLFGIVGTAQALLVETLVHAIEHLRQAEARGVLLLNEFRHRTRNDLQSLTGLMLLRARGAETEEAKCLLREAAARGRNLARVHGRLVAADRSNEMEAAADTREFLAGLTEDIMQVGSGDGLRPIGFVVEAEAYLLHGERAVPLGLVLNECLTNCLKYAFPDERSGMVRVGFVRQGEDFQLSVADDGVGLGVPPSSPGFGTRLLRGLAAQLRGSFVRHAGPDGIGAECVLRFPVTTPGFVSKPLQ
jgi:two-component sensor histidine kinase